MKWGNEITEKFNIKYPIIQAPMLGVSTAEMTAEISNQGGLGILPLGGLSVENTRNLIHKTKKLTDKPFAVNLFVNEIPEYDESDVRKMKDFILKLAKSRNYDLKESDLGEFKFYDYHDQIEVLIEEKIKIISFTFGVLNDKIIKLLKANNCILIGTATCLEEARIIEDKKIDIVIAQGIEAGGHRGTFIDTIIKEAALPEIDLIPLISQFKNNINIPIIAAGGINSFEGIKFVIDSGASAAQIGSIFMLAKESDAVDSYKERLITAKDTDKILTKAFSGRWARGVNNNFMKEIEKSGLNIPPFPYQNTLTTKLRNLAKQINDSDFISLWTGLSSCLRENKNLSSKEIFQNLIKES